MYGKKPTAGKMMGRLLAIRSIKLLHFVSMVAWFILCWLLYYHINWNTWTMIRFDTLMCGFYVVALAFLYSVYEAYALGLCRKREIIYSMFLANFIAVALIYFLYCLAFFKFANPLPMLGVFAIQTVVSVIWTLVAKAVYYRLFTRKKTAIIYRNENDLLRLEETKKFDERFEIVKYIADPPNRISELFPMLDDCEVIFVAGVNATLRNALAKYCVDRHVEGYFVPHVGDIIMMGAESVKQFSVPVINVHRARPNPDYLFVKRIFDIILSLLAIIILSPFMLLCAIAIKLYDHGPVLYKQTRLTRDGKEFKILKFRSMRVDAEKDGVARLSTGDKDDRVTGIGRILRMIRFDELPQLFNILSGSMTIVGPRPERPEISAQYEKSLPAFSMRLQVKAGLTGYAQIYGRYNSTPYDKLQMDLIYINNMSILEDIRLMFATVKVLFTRDSTTGVDVGQTTAMGGANRDPNGTSPAGGSHKTDGSGRDPKETARGADL